MANYRRIWEKYNGPIPIDEQGRSYEIHHIDGNRKNNSLSNLMCITIREHYKIHYDQGEWQAAKTISSRINLSLDERLNLNKLISDSRKKPIMHIKSGVVYESSKAAAIVNGVSSGTIVYQIKQGVFKVLTKGEYSILKQDTVKLEQVYVKQKGGDTQKKRILHIPTGEIYESAALAAKKFGWFPNNIGYYIKKGIFKYI